MKGDIMLKLTRNIKMPKSKLCTMRTSLSRASCIALMAMSGAYVTSTPIQAQQVTQAEFDGAKARVNLAGRLRMLNEKMAGSVCRVSADNQNTDARADLDATNAEYTRIMKALRESDGAIGIPTPEVKPRVLSKIWAIELQWVEVKYAANQMLKDIRLPEYVDVISRLTATDALALNLDKMESEIVARYSNPAELLTGDAFTISLMARQRKITQEISKLTCAVATGQPDFGTIEDLEKTMSLFDRSLSALENGMPAVGISAPPSPYIAERLSKLRADWLQISSKAVAAANSVDTLDATTATYDTFHDEINNLVALYMLSTQGQSDLYTVPLKAYAATEVAQWLQNPELIAAIKEQNIKNAALSVSSVEALDQQWRAETKSSGAKPLIDSTMSLPMSNWLKAKQELSGGLINEIFVMDNKGLNVAQSAETSDYWQGDEAKWQETFGNGSGNTHISDVEFDDSSGSFQSQVSLPIRDPETSELIGAVTVGVNVQSFL
jgi:hypothetical protein